MAQVLLLSFRWISLKSPCWYQSNLLFFVSGRISPHSFEMFSISPQQAYSFHCWFSNNSVQLFLRRHALSILFARVVISFPDLLCWRSTFFSFVPEALWLCSLRPIISIAKIMFFSLLIHPTGVLCPLLKFFSSYQVFHLISTGVFRCTSCPLQPFFSGLSTDKVPVMFLLPLF